MWNLMPQLQQRGSQIGQRKAGEAPDEATRDRAAQDHDYADLDTSPDGMPQDIVYPAGDIEHGGDNTPSVPDARAALADVDRPRRAEGVDDLGEGGEDLPADIEKGA